MEAKISSSLKICEPRKTTELKYLLNLLSDSDFLKKKINLQIFLLREVWL